MKYTDLGVDSPLYEKLKEKQRAVSEEKNAAIEQYEEMMRKQTLFVVDFTRVTPNKELDCFLENGIRIKMPLDKAGSVEKSRSLARSYEVVVTAVDKKKKEVSVSYIDAYKIQRKIVYRNLNRLLGPQKDNISQAEKAAKERLNEMMKEELSRVVSGMKVRQKNSWKQAKEHEFFVEEMEKLSNRWIIVPAVVKYVDKDKAFIDILGYNIPGILQKQHYAYTHIVDLSSLIKVGNIVDVAVLQSQKREGGRYGKSSTIFVCARTPLVKNPWRDVDYKVGDRIKVLCTKIYDSNWFGTVSGHEDIEIFCILPDRSKMGLDDGEPLVVLGHTYNCEIYRVNKERREIKARTFSEVTTRRR